MMDNILKLAELQERGTLRPDSEDALALIFAERYAGELRYVHMWGKWLRYDGTCWHHDDTLHVFDRVRDICREAARLSGKSSTVTPSAKTVAAVEKLARSDRRLAATTVQWDAQPWLLTTDGATIDLRTGSDRPPEASDYITKRTTCGAAPPGAPHPLFSAFLDRITGSDRELQQFLQRYTGYCLSGITTEHVFVFGYGTGANGKGTFLNTVQSIFGNYATTAHVSTFMASRTEQHPTDLAKLAGARLVVAQETQKGRRWDEIKIKAITGGDTISARFMRQDFFDFVPTFKIFVTGNYRPTLSAVDEAMHRRLLLVPFNVQIPRGDRDPKLFEKLKSEWPAILRWAIEGCLAWQALGLAPPASVLKATEDYFVEQDVFGQWLGECTTSGRSSAFTRTKELFTSWKTWAEERNLKAGSEKAFSELLAATTGFAKRRNNAGQWGFIGLTLNPY
ncbi:MAG TPA: phage/plasmid primase, P4 family [Xanthobacteraceae bacterium]|jgi:putative DNA primase/helicase|nr:phage/plasmid primase, P4 family [Xanthobacteraceae bacterium]